MHSYVAEFGIASRQRGPSHRRENAELDLRSQEKCEAENEVDGKQLNTL